MFVSQADLNTLCCCCPLARSKELLIESNARVQRLEEEKAQLQRALEGVGVDAVARRKVAAGEGAKAREAIGEIRERVRAEGLVLQEIQDSVKRTAQVLGENGGGESQMDLTE